MKKMLVAPLLIAVALTMLVTPASAFVTAVKSEGTAIAMGRGTGTGSVGRWGILYGDATLDYCIPWGYVWLEFCQSGDDLVYAIREDTIRDGSCLFTFKAGWVPCGDIPCPIGPQPTSDMITGNIRVVVFLDDMGCPTMVFAYGFGVVYKGMAYCCCCGLE